MLTNDIHDWLGSGVQTTTGSQEVIPTRMLKEMLASRLGVPLATNPAEHVNGVLLECTTRRSSVVLTEEVLVSGDVDALEPFVEEMCSECRDSNIIALKDVFCMAIMKDEVPMFVCAVRGIWL